MPQTSSLHLTLSLSGKGHLSADARGSPLARSANAISPPVAAAQRAEAGLFDSVFFLPSNGTGLDTMPLIGSLVAPTCRLGLGASVDMAHTEPFHTARAFAVLDNLSAGRTAWLLDLALPPAGDPAFAHRPALTAAAHYARAEEYVGVVMRLWDSWEDNAVIADKAAGIFADDRKIHPIHHVGTHFTVRGPLTAVRPVQGHPVIVVADTSPAGLHLAARFADVVLASCHGLDEAAALAHDLRTRTAAAGRPAGAVRLLLNLMPLLAATDIAVRARDAALDALAGGAAASPLTGHRFVGTAQGCADLMQSWHAAGVCDGFNLMPAALPGELDGLVDGLLPALRTRGLIRTGYQGTTLRGHLGLARPVNSFSAEGV